MANLLPRDVLLFAGGDALAKYDTLVRRTWPADRGGEQGKETVARSGAGATAISYLSPGVLGVAPAGANVTRVEWALDPVTGIVQLYWLLEVSRTTIWDQASDFTLGNWTREASTVGTAGGGATAPNGAAVDFVKEDGATAVHGLQRGTGALTDNATQATTIWAKASARSWLRIETTNKANSVNNTWFNLATGAVGTKAGAH